MFAEQSWRVVTQSGLLRRAAEQRASVTVATMVAGMIVVVTTPATAAACDHAGNWLNITASDKVKQRKAFTILLLPIFLNLAR